MSFDALKKFVPEASYDYCKSLWIEHRFSLKIKRGRLTKLGDYRHDLKTGRHVITVNNDLNPYSFLITYVHEVAHLVTFEEYGRKVMPHGVEWKRNFQKLMLPVLNDQIFPSPILRTLAAYLKNPKASSCNDHKLMEALNQFDEEPNLLLGDLQEGEIFLFGKRKFKKEKLRRTRFVCQDLTNGRRYLISKIAAVEKVA